MSAMKRWTSADALELYNVRGWGQGYYQVSEAGHMVTYPRRDIPTGIDLKELLEDAQRQGLSLPLLIRFSDVLADRLHHLHGCFARAISDAGYGGHHLAVYPIKVNQQRQVVEEIVRFGARHGMGLEVGSKPELHAALATLEGPDALIICNGYKDAEYVRMALLAQRLGLRVVLVVEKPGELPLILRIAREVGLEPLLGVRIRLATSGSGRWEDSGGDHSKFGLASWELLAAVEWLREQGALHCLRMIHSHLGSQITSLRRIEEAMAETARFYAELRALGCPLDTVDVGGGLGVDYDGTHSTRGFSVNYSEQDYAHAVVGGMARFCRAEALPEPTLVTEAGRALTAHHAMLAVNVLETSRMDGEAQAGASADDDAQSEAVRRLQAILAEVDDRNYTERWQEAQKVREEAMHAFEAGGLSLQARAAVDTTFWAVARAVEGLMRGASRDKRAVRAHEELETLLADKYFCNFSVFQSLPDAWALGQEFPVAPLHRLNERPTRSGTLQDITCDSDGRLTGYISGHEKRGSLPLHPLRPGEPYYVGIFLTGAYQEILGDLHNLFGDSNAIHVALQDDGTWHYEQVIQGETSAKVLAYVQFSRDILVDRIERQVDNAVRAGRMSHREGKDFRNLYVKALEGYTYLNAPPDQGEGAPARPKAPGARAGVPG